MWPDPPISDLDDRSRTPVATPSYASGDILVGRPADTRDDIYALACICYVMMTGKHPFNGQNAVAARQEHLTPKRPAQLSDRQWRALSAGLRHKREHRPADVQKWLEQITLPSQPAPLPPLLSVMGALPVRDRTAYRVTAGLAVLIAAIGWWAHSNPDLVKNALAGLSATATQLWNEGRVDARSRSPANPLAHIDHLIGQPGSPVAAPQVIGTGGANTLPKTVQSQAATVKATPGGAQMSAPRTEIAPPKRALIELASATLDVAPTQSVARVTVLRRRSYRSDVSFSWWTESGTAQSGVDFVPVHYRVDFIPDGRNETTLLVSIVADPSRKVAKTFYVVLGAPGDRASLGSRTLTMVTILPAN